MRPRWSVIVPVWNEGPALADALARLRATPGGKGAEIVVVDGGSEDGTPEAAEGLADKLIRLDRPGRGRQQRAGAAAAAGERLLFLHADVRLPEDWAEAVDRALRRAPAPAATAFRVRYASRGWQLRLIEGLVHLRARLFGVVYGDHAIAVPRAAYEACGGMPEIPLMEDIAFCRALRRVGRIELLPERVRPSERRQRGAGALRNALRNHGLVLLFLAGVPPERLWRMYYNRRKDSS